MYWGHMGDWGWGGWLASIPITLIFFGALAAVIVLLVRRPADGASETPERILAERFARGDIEEDEYHRRRRALRG